PDNYRTRLDAQWPVYTGGRLQALERAARTELAAVDHDRAALQSDVRADVARAYWSLVAADASIEVLDRAIARVDAHLRDARNRLAAGLVAPNDVTSAEAQLARQRMLRIQAGANRDTAEAALARLVGVAPGTGIETATPVDGAATAVPGFDDLLTEARERRADRRALDTRVSAAGLRRDAAAAGRRPTVAVAAGVDYARPNPRIFPRQGSWRESWDAGINVDWPLFDGGRARAETAEAAAAQRAAEARLAEFDALLALEIRRRLSELTAGRAAIDAADAEIAAATETHRVAAERFAAGVATSTDVLDAQLTILQAGLDRTQAAVAVRLAEADLARAVGRERP
ncbi:MAG: TolC family protein, partial [Vicinamibacterales bacterium]